MQAGWTWFPKNKGLINGITLLGFGSGAFIFNKVGTGLALSGMPWGDMLRRLATIYAVVAVSGAAMVKRSRSRRRRRSPTSATSTTR